MFRGMFSKENFSSLGWHCLDFIKRFFCTVIFYVLGGIGYALAVGVTAIPVDIPIILVRILLTIAPIPSVLNVTLIKDEDKKDEISMDLCLAFAVLTIIFAWII